MNKPEEKNVAMKALYEAEENADAYRKALLEMSMENDQLYNDYCAVYDKLCQVSARIDMVGAGFSDPVIAISEIRDIIKVERD